MEKTLVRVLIEKFKNPNEVLAHAAFKELLKRVLPQISAQGSQICRKSFFTNSRENAQDLVQDVCIKVFAGLSKFKVEVYPDEQALVRGILAWTRKIAFREWTVLFKSKKRESEESGLKAISYYQEERLNAVSNEREEDNKYHFKREGTSKLTTIGHEEFDVIMASLSAHGRDMLFAKLDGMPKSELKRLAETHHKTKSNIRTINSRNVAKVKDDLLKIIDKQKSI